MAAPGRPPQASTTEARRDNAGGTVAIVDEAGNLVGLERCDGTFAASATICIGKARTTATTGRRRGPVRRAA